jgi:hypothetical protein
MMAITREDAFVSEPKASDVIHPSDYPRVEYYTFSTTMILEIIFLIIRYSCFHDNRTKCKLFIGYLL